MKKYVSICLGICLMVLLTACGKVDASEDAIAIDKKDRVTRYFIDNDFAYDAAEIQSMMEEELSAYNSRLGTDHIKLKECSLKEGTLRIQIQCDEAKYYQDYCSYYNDDFATEESDVELYAGALSGAGDYDFAASFVTPAGEAADVNTIFSESKAKVVIFNEPVEVFVPGKILYVSDNLEVLGEKQARVRESDGTLQRSYIIYI